MLLALDTATNLLSLALHDGDTLLAELSWHTNNSHTTDLAPAIHEMLRNAGITAAELTAVAVATGPGSYTGVRIGVAMAKGLANANNTPLIGVTTLDVVAAAQPKSNGALIAVVRAGRGRIIVGRYRWAKNRWTTRGEVDIMAWPDLFESIDGQVTLAGYVNAQGRDALDAACAAQPELTVTIARPVYNLRRAGFLAEVAWERLRTDGPSAHPASQVIPVYAKNP